MRNDKYRLTPDRYLLMLSGGNLAIAISKKTGNIERILLKGKKYLWNSFGGNLAVKDDLAGREFNEEHDQCSVRAKRLSDTRLQVEKRFKGSDFVIREIWFAEEKFIRWDLSVFLDRGKEKRSIEIRFRLPWTEKNWGTDVWAASPVFPTKTNRLVGNSIEYGEGNYGVILPVMTFYKPKDNVGITVAKPLGFKVPRLRFCIPHWYEKGPEVEFSFLRLDTEQPARVSLLFAAHEGCWRPALRWFSDLYPEYFTAPNQDVRKLEGGYIMTSPSYPVKKLEIAKKYGVRWAEIHQHFPVHGNYIPLENEWREGSRCGKVAGIVTKRMIREHCRAAMKNGIYPLLYFQCAGDGDIPYVEKEFPESIAVSPAKKKMLCWINCCLMNSDERTKFGRYVREQISRIFSEYPEIGGIFLDQLCYNGIDTAHDDGVTMYKNRPAYMLAFCYWESVKRLAEEVHKRGKFIISNGPYDVEVQRYVDGHMAEGLSWRVDMVKYVCIRKPLLFLSYYNSVEKAEQMFQNCLLAGASYSINMNFLNPKVERLIKAYLPMIKRLEGRRWLLEPAPVVFPENNEGNIFEAEDGNVIVTMVKTRRSIFDVAGLEKGVEVEVMISAVNRVREVTCRGAEYHGEKKVRIRKAGKRLTLTLPLHGAATLITLKLKVTH